MEQQPYGQSQSEPDRTAENTDATQYGYEQQGSYYDFASIQPGSKRAGKRLTFRRVVGTVLFVVGLCLFSLPFLHMFGVFHFLGFGPESMTPEHLNGTFSFMTAGFIGFGLLVLSTFIRGKGK